MPSSHTHHAYINILLFLKFILLIQWLTFVYYLLFCSFESIAFTSPSSFADTDHKVSSSSPHPNNTFFSSPYSNYTIFSHPSPPPSPRPPSSDLPAQLSNFHDHIHNLQTLHYPLLDKLETLLIITEQHLRVTLVQLQYQILSHKSRLQQAEWKRLWNEWYHKGKRRGKFGLEVTDIQVKDDGQGELEKLGLWKEDRGEYMVWINTTNVEKIMDMIHDLFSDIFVSKIRIKGLDNSWIGFVESFLSLVEEVLDAEGIWGWRRLKSSSWVWMKKMGKHWWRKCNHERLMKALRIICHFGGLVWLTRVLKVRLHLRLWRSERQRGQEVFCDQMQGRLHYAASDNNNLSRNLQHGLQSRKMVFSSSQSNFASQITPTRSSTIIPTRLSASSTSQIIPTISPTQPRLNLDMASSNQIISDINEGSVDSDTSTDYVYAYDNAHTPKHHHTYVDYRSSPPYQSSDSSLSSGSSSSSNSYLDHQHHIETLTAPSETHTMIQNRNENSQLQPFDSLLSSGSISSSDSNLDQIGMRSSLETHSRVQNRDESLQTSTLQYTISNYIRVRLFKIIHHPIFFYMILTLTTYLTIVQLYTLSNYSCSSSLSSINTNTSTSLILRYPSTNFFFTEENGRESQRDESKPSPQAILIPAFQEGIIVPLVLYKQWWGDGMRLLEDVERLVVFVEEIRRGMEESDEGWDINKRNEKNERNENSENLGKEEKQWSIPKFFKPFLFPFGKNNSDFKFDAMEHQIEEEELREDEVELSILRKQIESIKGLKFNDIFLEIVEELVEDVEEGAGLGREWIRGIWDVGRWKGLRIGVSDKDEIGELKELGKGLRELIEGLEKSGRGKKGKEEGLWQWEGCWVKGEREKRRMMMEAGKGKEKEGARREWEDDMDMNHGDKCIVWEEEWEEMKSGVFREWH